MRFKRHCMQEKGFSSLTFFPMLNLVLLVLIFVALSPGFIVSQGVAVELPKFATSQMIAAAHRELVVAGDNALYWDTVQVDQAQLASLLAKCATRKEPVLIKADARAALGVVAQVLDLARAQKVAQVYIATD